VKRRDTYLEALGQGVVAGEVGLEPHLGLDVRAGGVLGRLARAAAAAAAMVEVGRCVSVTTSGTVVRRAAVARDRRVRSRERPHRPKIRSARDVAVDRLVDLMTLGA
jgi:sulfite reductase beta subunit-like hemoprotein